MSERERNKENKRLHFNPIQIMDDNNTVLSQQQHQTADVPDFTFI